MSCQGNLLLMKVTSSTIIAMVVKLTCKCSIIELCVEKKIITNFWSMDLLLQIVSGSYYLSSIKFPHYPQNWVFNKYLLIILSYS